MRFNQIIRDKCFLAVVLLLLALLSWSSESSAGELQLSWADNSTNEDGFKIERKTGTTGTYAQIATVGANVTSYTDAALVAGATYCYQVRAFNSAGNSPYTPEVCGAARSTVQTFNLVTTKTGSGSGTVTSTDGGINCGSTCSKVYNSGTVVQLNASASAGSIFAGWSGTGCPSTGSVTMDANKTCTATFSLQTITTYTLTVAKTGAGSGTVTSTDGGINCGSTCSKVYNSGTSVTLNATPATGSVFAGWSGTGCSSTGSITMNANKTCTATFNLPTVTAYNLTVAKIGTGSGNVTSADGGINCGGDCSESYASGTVVALTATAAAGSTFVGWSGTGCTTGSVTMNTSVSCAATFQPAANLLTTRIGVFRPDTGEWFLDDNGNGQWDGCGVDICINSFGQTGDLPVVGSWSGNGTSNIGIFSPSTGTWQLDTTGDRVLNCAVDTCFSSFGQPGDLPVTRELNGLNVSIIGTFTPRTTVKINKRNRTIRGLWNFDLSGNYIFDDCSVDACDIYGDSNELPVVGDWSGSGSEEIGVFLPRYGKWYLDLNGNGKWDGKGVDKLLGRFGRSGDRPVVGDWDGTGNIRIGVFRPDTGEWFLDLNGNGIFDGCQVDICISQFGQAGDLPVIGKW
jgi:hypothetical protein